MDRCQTFVPFEPAPDVCDTCGETADCHAASMKYTPYIEALWATLLKHGGIPSAYGLYDDSRTLALRGHLRRCSIDYTRSEEPIMDRCSEFGGTFTETNYYVEAVVGHLFCACDLYKYQQVALKNRTLSQLIWMTVKEGEIGG